MSLVISELESPKFERKGTLCRTDYFITVYILNIHFNT